MKIIIYTLTRLLNLQLDYLKYKNILSGFKKMIINITISLIISNIFSSISKLLYVRSFLFINSKLYKVTFKRSYEVRIRYLIYK